MKVLICGAGGLIGRALCEYLRALGYYVAALRRVDGQLDPQNGPCWNIAAGKIDFADFADVDIVVHLAGESIATGRWNKTKKQRIIDSRVDSTHLLAMAIAGLRITPSLFICASAIGFYGDRGDVLVDESSDAGVDGFVSKVAKRWEHACLPVTQSATRLVNLRTGLVLSRHGGALKRMLLPFKLGLGGVIGDGKQYMSWIAMEDMLRGVQFIIEQHGAVGPINMVSPNPVTNEQFTQALGKVLHRPTRLPMSASMARFIFGQMADELLLSSTKVAPTKLQALGFEFNYEHITEALKSTIYDRQSTKRS